MNEFKAHISEKPDGTNIFVIDNRDALELFTQKAAAGDYIIKITRVKNPRTIRQNRALHLLFTNISDALVSAGLDIQKTLEPNADISWSPELVKELLWRPLQKAELGKESTTELSTTEIDKVFDTLNRFLAKHGITEPFPSIEEIMHQQRISNQ